jgi:hypothetical protein
MAVIIDDAEEFTRDWDWYVVDQGTHWPLHQRRHEDPKSVKNDLEATELIARYFFEHAPVTGGWSVRAAAEKDCGGWERQGFERYVRDFALMATKGLFSFDTDLVGGQQARYYLVAIPERPLHVSDLPLNIKELVSRTASSLRLSNCHYIAGQTTEAW